MYLGIDVGGTHTDAVAMDRGGIVASEKVVTDHADLFSSVRQAMEKVLQGVDPGKIRRLNLSTTLTTNAIVESKMDDVGVLVSGGPGIDPDNYHIGGNYFIIPGSIDHRGREVASLDEVDIDAAVAECRERGLRVFASVTKFSPRNPAQELAIQARLQAGLGSDADFISLGHRLSGVLSFPRRVATTFYNAAVWRTYNTFADAIEGSVRSFGLQAPLNTLKADGGTMPFALSRVVPVESILSGPAASVMGIIALCDIRDDCVILDIGGTTTDIGVFASGSPVLENDGISLGSYPTLVRALLTRSIGIGGDSRVHINAGEVRVGPERKGPPAAQGGKTVALMDAFNYLGLAQVGDQEASVKAVKQLAGLWDMLPDKLAQRAVKRAVGTIKDEVEDMVWTLNQRPVYTIDELLTGREIRPKRTYCMGGPAAVFQPLLTEALGHGVRVPENYAVANAIGSALARTTSVVEVFADTQKGKMFIPNLGFEKSIERKYDLAAAETDAREHLRKHLLDLGVDEREIAMDITEASSFNMVDNAGGGGRNIRVKCQVRPGILAW